jgi:predicted N-acetyltransferase YhbS
MTHRIVSVRENPEYLNHAADYFSSKWRIGCKLFNDSITHSIDTPNPLPRWYLLVKESNEVVGCFGLIANDFNSRQDLWPWFAALHVEESERGQALGKMLLAHGRAEAKRLGFAKLYLETNHVGFYEKYGWRHIGKCYGIGDELSRLYEVEC